MYTDASCWRTTGSPVRPSQLRQAQQALPGPADAAVAAAAALEAERGEGDLPALPDRTEAQVVGDPHVGEEDLVERRPAGHLPDRPDLDTRRVQRDQEGCHPCVLGHRRIGPRDEFAPAGELRARAPHLLAADYPVVSVSLRTGRQARQIRACAGLGKQLAAQFLGAKEPADEPGLLLGSAEQADRRRDQVSGDREGLMPVRCGEVGLHLVEGSFMRVGKTGSAVLGWPGDGSVAGVALLLLPGHGPVEQRPFVVERQPVEHRHVVAALTPSTLVGVGPGQPGRKPVSGGRGELLDAGRLRRSRPCRSHDRVPWRAAAGGSHLASPGGHAEFCCHSRQLVPPVRSRRAQLVGPEDQLAEAGLRILADISVGCWRCTDVGCQRHRSPGGCLRHRQVIEQADGLGQ